MHKNVELGRILPGMHIHMYLTPTVSFCVKYVGNRMASA